MVKKTYITPLIVVDTIELEESISAGSAELSGGNGSNIYQPIIDDNDNWSSGTGDSVNVDF